MSYKIENSRFMRVIITLLATLSLTLLGSCNRMSIINAKVTENTGFQGIHTVSVNSDGHFELSWNKDPNGVDDAIYRIFLTRSSDKPASFDLAALMSADDLLTSKRLDLEYRDSPVVLGSKIDNVTGSTSYVVQEPIDPDVYYIFQVTDVKRPSENVKGIVVASQVRLAEVSSIAAVFSTAGVELSWPEVAGALSYDIYTDETLTTRLATTTSTSHIFTPTDGLQSVVVVARRGSLSSSSSISISVNPTVTPPPDPGSGVVAPVLPVAPVRPSVTITSTEFQPANVDTIPITVVFSGSVTGFTLSDITVTNGTKGNFAGSGTTYTFDITAPGALGSIDIAEAVAMDAEGDQNTAASSFSFGYFVLPPPSLALLVGSVPDGISSTPNISWTAVAPVGVTHYQVRVLKTADNSQAVPWTTSASGGALTALSLDRYAPHYAEVRAVNAVGQKSTVAATESWIPDSEDCKGAQLTAAPYAGGTGTYADPHKICTATQFSQISVNEGIHYSDTFAQAASIDLTGLTFVDYAMVSYFEGRYFGQNKIIRNMTVTATGGGNNGFIGNAESARVDDLIFLSPTISAPNSGYVAVLAGETYDSTFNNIEIINANVAGFDYVGLLSGYPYDAYFIHIRASGVVTGDNRVGGFYGYSFNNSTIDVDLDVTVTGDDYIGGFGGMAYGSDIQNATITATVSGDNGVGGLLGLSEGGGARYYRTHLQGSVTGNTRVGGLAGLNYDSFNVRQSSFDAVISGASRVGGIVGHADASFYFHDSYVKGSIVGTGPGGSQDMAGGIAGHVTTRIDVRRSYSDVDISGQFAKSGGIAGLVDALALPADLVLDNVFSTGDVAGNSGSSTVSRMIGSNLSGQAAGASNYYWSGAGCTNSSGLACNTTVGTPVVSLSAFSDETIAPLVNFDFVNVWEDRPNALPSLRTTQTHTPVTGFPCGVTGVATNSFNCTVTDTDSDVNEFRAIKLLNDHTCGWATGEGLNIGGFMPNSYIGTCTMSFVISDGVNDSLPQTFTFTVTP